MSVYFSPISRGLGDLVISLPALQALIASGEETILVVRSPAQLGLAAYIPGLSGTITEPDFLSQPRPAGSRYVNLRDHPLQTECRWDTPQFKALYPDYLIMEVTERIAADNGIVYDFTTLHPLPHRTLPQLRQKILLVPGSSHDVKRWPVQHWLALSERLEGRVLVVGEPDKSCAVEELLQAGLPHWETPTFGDLVDAVSSALSVVSIDTGPMHLAIHQGTPTVGLYLSNPFYRRREAHTAALVAPPCGSRCLELSMEEPLNEDVEWQSWAPLKNWQCQETEADRCMTQIAVDAVLDRLQQLWTSSKADRSPEPAL